jgi:3-methyladenine DNA glycosylase AlkC
MHQVSTLLDLSNGHSLKVLAQESRSENATMRALSERGFRDAVAIKVLTIVTLVYLPTTVVAVSFDFACLK